MIPGPWGLCRPWGGVPYGLGQEHGSSAGGLGNGRSDRGQAGVGRQAVQKRSMGLCKGATRGGAGAQCGDVQGSGAGPCGGATGDCAGRDGAGLLHGSEQGFSVGLCRGAS